MKVIVLNAGLRPINVTTFKKGFKLIYKGKAEVLETYEDDYIVTYTRKFLRPRVIRLLNYVNLPYRKLSPTKRNIFKRDNFTCMYCPGKKDLTLDHVQPKSRGGKDTWKNLVTACSKCNNKKDNKTPQEAGMKLRKAPTAPSLMELLDLDSVKIFESLAKAYTY